VKFLSWVKVNGRLILAGASISFLSASVSGISLVLVQGVFGKEKSGSSTDLARKAILSLGEDRAILIAIAIWGFSVYFLNNFNERLTSRRLEAKRSALIKDNVKLSSKDQRFLTNESHFFESVIGFLNNIIRTVVFAGTLLLTSPLILKTDVVVAMIYIGLICIRRFRQGIELSHEQRQLELDREKQRLALSPEERRARRRENGRQNGRDYSDNFDIFIKRSWLSAKLEAKQLGTFVLLIVAPFFLSDVFSLNILNEMVLFNFTTLLIFFSNSIHLAIHSAGFGYRYSRVFDAGDAGDSVVDEDNEE
jgi:hypothetical protein